MKIYTGRGDKGQTSIFTGEQVLKSDDRVEAYGTIDELGAVLALAESFSKKEETLSILGRVQKELFLVGAELASNNPEEKLKEMIEEKHVKMLEKDIDDITKKVDLGHSFVVPRPYAPSASLHLARTVARRAERAVVRYSQESPVRNLLLVYLNRLSDLLFILANYEDKEEK